MAISLESSSTTTATVKLPKKLHQEMQLKIIGDGYGMRGRSKWIQEAIEAFLSQPNFEDLADIASVMEELHVPVNIRCKSALTKRLDDAILEVRKKFPLMDGVKSNIIRAAICQRLLISG